MMKNLNCCYFNNLINQAKYIKFINDGNYAIHVIVQYVLGGGCATEEATITPGHSKKINLPSNATNIALNILNLTDPDPFTSIICHDSISGEQNFCYKTYNTAQHPMFQKFPC